MAEKLIDWDRVRDAARGAVEGFTGATDERIYAAQARGVVQGSGVALDAYNKRTDAAEGSQKLILGLLAAVVIGGLVLKR